MPARAAIARKLIQLACDGYLPALKYLYDRCDGKPAIVNRILDEADLPEMVIANAKGQIEQIHIDRKDEIAAYRIDDPDYDDDLDEGGEADED